jgi:hypothetical protein
MMTEAQVLQVQELTLSDRCDACGAAAQVRATLLSGELLFCGHHARKHYDALAKTALTLYDPNDSLPVLEGDSKDAQAPDIIVPTTEGGNDG